ncbi:ribbon-helix-helix protein, CopG family [Nocardioides ginsengisegetis]
MPDELWEAAQRAASDRGESVAEVIRRALEQYVRSWPSN